MIPTLRTSIVRIVAEAFPQLVYGYPRTYIVAAVRSDKTLDLVPPADAQHLPELNAVEQWGPAGHVLNYEDGAEVTVVFRDADPSRPVVVSALPPVDTEATARQGDIVGRAIWDVTSATLWYSAGNNADVVPVPYAPVATNPQTPPNPPLPTDPGTELVITSGSDLVEAG
jgi:hypothetical protein